MLLDLLPSEQAAPQRAPALPGGSMLLDLLGYYPSQVIPVQPPRDTSGSRYVPAPRRVRSASRYRIRLSVHLGPAEVVGRQTIALPIEMAVASGVRSSSAAALVLHATVLNPRHEADDDLSLLLLLNGDR